MSMVADKAKFGQISDAGLLIDITADFCQAVRMFRLPRKFIAVLLAVWLPLFGGNALAASVGAQSMNGGCHDAQQSAHPSQQDPALHQQMHHAQLAANGNQSTGQHDSQSFPCSHCGMCQLVCSGYMAAAAIKVPDAQPLAQSFTLVSAQFQSFTSAPLDPPPLALA